MAVNPYNSGIIYQRFFANAPDKEAVTRFHEYEDAGRSFNRLNDNAPRTWERNYSGLTVRGVTNDAAIFDEHFEEKGLDTPFLLIDKLGNSHAVYYKSFDVISQTENRTDIQQRRIVFIEYPGVSVDELPPEPLSTPSIESFDDIDGTDYDGLIGASSDDDGSFEYDLRFRRREE